MSEIQQLYKVFKESKGVSTDSRKAEPGSIFFALKGDNFNGNEYAHQALEAGALLAVVDEGEHGENSQILKVDDVLKTLQDLANHHRSQFLYPVLGITGSNGKTTTKELLYAVLSEKYNVLATAGNFNNHIGVPLTLLRMTDSHDFAIIEMGANHLHEIEFLCNISDPDFGLLTNIGRAHIEGFGSLEGVKVTKSELYWHVRDKGGKVFVNAQDPVLMEQSKGLDRILYNESNGDSKVVQKEHAMGTISVIVDSVEIDTQLFGDYNFTNICSALAVGKYFGVALDKMKKGLEKYQPNNNRSQLIKTKNNTIVLDAYNANPSSMGSALDSFSHMKGQRIAVIGDMLELGETSRDSHTEIYQKAKSLGIEEIILVGSEFGQIDHGDELHFKSTEELSEYFKENPPLNKIILIKGSRGIGLEKLTEYIP